MNISDYPGAPNIIELSEKLKQWPMYLGCYMVEGLAGVKKRMREGAESSCKMAELAGEAGKRDVLLEALVEWNHPDFDRYLEDKFKVVQKELFGDQDYLL